MVYSSMKAITAAAILGLLVSGCDSLVGPDQRRYDAIVAGGFHNCARSEGKWFCWGEAQATRLGTGDTTLDWTIPQPLREDPGLLDLSAGETFTCGLTASGRAYCWGRNDYGALGLGFLGQEYDTPQAVDTDLRFSQLAGASTPSHMCGIANRRAYCWGNNFRSQLGADLDVLRHPEVTAVLGDHEWTLLAAGGPATCGLDLDGDVYCWGGFEPGTDNDLREPTLFAPAAAFDTIVPFAWARCGLRSGMAFCHGRNTLGELGTGDSLPHEGFVAVADDVRFLQLSGGRVHICGVATTGDAYCWGAGTYGRLGNGTEDRALVPTKVAGGLKFAQVAAGGDHTCGLTSAGEVYCWGSGVYGQLGNGGTEDALTPVRIADPPD